MSFASVGDLSRAFSLRAATSRTKGLLTSLSRELASGVKSDLPKSVGGDTRRLASVEHRLRTVDALRRNAEEVGGRLDAGQTAMAGMQAIASGLGTGLLSTSVMTGAQTVEARLAGAGASLDAAIGLLNTGYAGEFVFSGARTATRPLAGSEPLLAAVTTAITGLTDIDDIVAAVDHFFDAPAGGGGYVDQIYLGAAEGPGAVSVSAERSIDSDLTAASPSFRELLKGLTLASLAAGGVIGGSGSDRLAVTQAAGTRILNAETRLIQARSAQGVRQESVEVARSRNAAEISTLRIARNEMVAADPYETAAALTEAQVQLEGLYAVTARLAQLSLAKRL